MALPQLGERVAGGRRGPLADSYPGAVALVACSLIPFLALTAAVLPLSKLVAASLHISVAALELTVAMSTAAYAAGTVIAVQLAVHLPARRLLVCYEALFLLASVLSAWAPNAGVFIGAFITQGLCTSLMLIAAVPPLVTGWPPKKMPVTGGVMNLCIFGAVAVGPTVGALQLGSGGWRPLFWGVAVVAALALAFSLLTYQDDPPSGRDAPWDFVALASAVLGCGAAFFGAGELQTTLKVSAEALVPLLAGGALLVFLVVHQYRQPNPLMPVRAAFTTVPVAGIFLALTASAASFGIMELALQVLAKGPPDRAAVLFLPEFVAAIVVAAVFGRLFRTRFTPVLAIGGLAVIVGAAALLLELLPATPVLLAAVAGMLGLGVGASVSPALFMAGFSLRSQLLQRVFAMIELMRGVTAFLVAPVLVFLAGVLGATTAAGTVDAVWICLGIAAVGFLGGWLLYATGRRGLVAPDLQRWQGEAQEPAWASPPLFARLRGSRAERPSGGPTTSGWRAGGGGAGPARDGGSSRGAAPDRGAGTRP